MSKKIWPNFFIIGAAKAGTTSLYEYLDRTDGIFMSKIKESHYFSPSMKTHHLKFIKVVRNTDEYLSLFDDAGNAIAIGEASVSYLTDKESASLIHSVVPNSKIIVMLRDPINRAFSHYHMAVRTGAEQRSFYDAVTENYHKSQRGLRESDLYVETGFYASHLKRFIDIFGQDRMKVLIFEEFVKDSRRSVGDVLEFLEVNSGVPRMTVKSYYGPKGNLGFYSMPRSNFAARVERSIYQSVAKSSTLSFLIQKSPWYLKHSIREKVFRKEIEKPVISEEARSLLQDIYRRDFEELESIMGRSIPWDIK